MNAEPASLTAGLLARKGEATPAKLFALPQPAQALPQPQSRAKVPERGVGPRRRITLRLDPARHKRLKLASAHLGLSLQDIVIAALDAHLVEEAPCPCLADGTPPP